MRWNFPTYDPFKIKTRFERTQLEHLIHRLLLFFPKGLYTKLLFSSLKEKNKDRTSWQIYSTLQKPWLKPQIIAKCVHIKWTVYFMYDFVKPLQIPMPGFVPHFQGFDVKVPWHKLTKVFSMLIFKTRKERKMNFCIQLWLQKPSLPGF